MPKKIPQYKRVKITGISCIYGSAYRLAKRLEEDEPCDDPMLDYVRIEQLAAELRGLHSAMYYLGLCGAEYEDFMRDVQDDHDRWPTGENLRNTECADDRQQADANK